MAVTRLAPSPTGALHLGNARTLVLTWLWARTSGARLVFRLEDIDSPRKKPGAVDQLFEDLRWLCVDWDGDVVVQSDLRAGHESALGRLQAADVVYPCVCTRRDATSAASAPHAEDEARYPGTCRDRFPDPEAAFAASGRPVAFRFRTPPGLVLWRDRFRGDVEIDPSAAGGDFVLARWDPQGGLAPGYQLAVVVDDAAQGVDTVIRGDDLVPSTPRQILLQRALGLPTPDYVHLPLVVGPDGRRLAKRHGDTRLAAYREAGVPASRILEWIAAVSGIDAAMLRSPRDSGFRWDLVPRSRVVVPPHAVRDGPPTVL